MEIKKDYDFNDLREECWSGAINTLEIIEKNDKEEELMELLEEEFGNVIPTMTEVNDFLWFEDDFIFEQLGINDNGENEDEE